MNMDKNTMTYALIAVFGMVALSQVASVIYSTFFDQQTDAEKVKANITSGSKKVSKRRQPHLVIVGPSGSGKTTLF